ncbi:MAG: RNA polymerase sigma factor [Candidatus Dormibacteria bacterium]
MDTGSELRILPGAAPPDGEAWAWLRVAIADHGPMLWRFVLPRLAGDHDAADSICQEVWQALSQQPTPPREIGAWIRGTARHKVLDRYRRERRRTFWEVPLEVFAGTSGDPEEQLEAQWDNEQVYAALRRLPVRFRQVLVLHYLEGWSVAELAALLNRSSKAIECQLYRARAAFRGNFPRENHG